MKNHRVVALNNGRCTLVKAVAACYKILTIIIDMKFAVAGIHIKSTDSKIFSALAVKLVVVAVFVAIVALSACSNNEPWNNPYPADESGLNISYAPFSGRPKHLDPAQSYSSNEIAFTAQIYEPPLQYHFLKRPYQLIPLTTTAIPKASFPSSIIDNESRVLTAT